MERDDYVKKEGNALCDAACPARNNKFKKPLTEISIHNSISSMERIFFHVDMDAFFASVEQADNPALAGKPVIVGAAPGRRGVVSTCSYEARAFGVHSAMPIAEAARLCPHGVFLPVRMKRYSEVSTIIMSILFTYTPDVLQLSIDEAMLDMTGTEKLWGTPEECAYKMKRTIRERTGLTISIGASANRYVAKIASGISKPDGFLLIKPGNERAFMRSLPLEKLWGAGEKTRERLKARGLTTMAAIQDAPVSLLMSIFGNAGGRFLAMACQGQDPGVFTRDEDNKSISTERTFEADISDRTILIDELRMLADELSFRLWDSKLHTGCVGIKLRFADFTSITRQRSLAVPTDSADCIFQEATRLFDANWICGKALRLIGIFLSSLVPESHIENSLFQEEPPKSALAEQVVHELQKSGKGNLIRGTRLNRRG